MSDKKKMNKSDSDKSPKKSKVSLSDVDAKLKKKADEKREKPSKDNAEKSKPTDIEPNQGSDVEIDIDIKIHLKRFKLLRMVIVGAIVLLGLVGLLIIFGVGNSDGDSSEGDEAIQEVFKTEDQGGTSKLLESRQGFAVDYDSAAVTASATVVDGNGQTSQSSGEDLDDWGEYSEARFSVNSESRTEILIEGDVLGEVTVATNTDESFFADQREEFGQDLTDLELAKKFYAPKSTTKEKVRELDTNSVSVGQTEYQVTSYEVTGEYGITDVEQQLYITVQNETPYALSMKYSKGISPGRLQDLSSIIESAEYTPPIRDSVGSVNPTQRPTHSFGATLPFLAQVDQSLPGNAINEADGDLRDSTILNVVARNAIATVRVAHFECRDLDFLLPGGGVAFNAPNACNGGIGSGSIVGEDGYISTNGHVAVISDSNVIMGFIMTSSVSDLTKYVDYLEDIGILQSGAGDFLLNDFLAGSQSAAQAIIASATLIPKENVRFNSSDLKYAIQLSNEPLEADLSSLPLDFEYTDTVIAAERIDYDFDPESIENEQADLTNQSASDVALLRADITGLPTVDLGSIDSVSEGDLITAIGFPVFVDGGFEPRTKKTIASATQGEVVEITSDNIYGGSGRKLISTDVRIAQGNSGGPSFNAQGEAVGVATYGDFGSCGTGDCLGYGGVMRDIADFKALLDKNDVTIDESSHTTTQKWVGVLDNFSIGYFKTAIGDIEEFEETYNRSYLSGLFKNVAERKVANGESLEPGLPFKAIALGAAVTLPLIIVTTTLALYAHRRKGARVGIAYPVNPLSANVQYASAAYANLPNPNAAAQQPANYNPYPADIKQGVVQPTQAPPAAQQPQQQAPVQQPPQQAAVPPSNDQTQPPAAPQQ